MHHPGHVGPLLSRFARFPVGSGNSSNLRSASLHIFERLLVVRLARVLELLHAIEVASGV